MGRSGQTGLSVTGSLVAQVSLEFDLLLDDLDHLILLRLVPKCWNYSHEPQTSPLC